MYDMKTNQNLRKTHLNTSKQLTTVHPSPQVPVCDEGTNTKMLRRSIDNSHTGVFDYLTI